MVANAKWQCQEGQRERRATARKKNAAESDTEWSSEAITKSTELRQMSNFCIPNEEQLKSGMHAMANVVRTANWHSFGRAWNNDNKMIGDWKPNQAPRRS